jgi:hypothetical protein
MFSDRRTGHFAYEMAYRTPSSPRHYGGERSQAQPQPSNHSPISRSHARTPSRRRICWILTETHSQEPRSSNTNRHSADSRVHIPSPASTKRSLPGSRFPAPRWLHTYRLHVESRARISNPVRKYRQQDTRSPVPGFRRILHPLP